MTTRHRAPDRRRIGLGLGLFVLFLVVVVGAFVVPPLLADPAPPAVTLRGISGSESTEFLTDPQVNAELAAHGLALAPVEPSGSFDIPTRGDLDVFDYALPSSDPAGRALQAQRGVPATPSPFSSPMVVVTYPAVVSALQAAGALVPGPDGVPALDVVRLAGLVAAGRRWGEIAGSTVPAPTREILLSTTEPGESNSAAMFLALASYALNGNRVVTTPAEIEAVLPGLCPMLRDQGAKPRSSEYLFEGFLRGGPGSMPMALVYENQVLRARADGRLGPDRVVLALAPTVLSEYTFVPLHEPARRMGQLLVDDPVLVRRAAELGFRPADPRVQPANAGPLPSDVVPTPSFDTLQALRAAVVARCS